MVARNVMKAWQAGLDGPPVIGKVYHPDGGEHPDEAERLDEGGEDPYRSAAGWDRPEEDDDGPHRLPVEDGDEDPEIRVIKLNHIVPFRRGVSSSMTVQSSGFWTSHHFWKGVVVGAVIVLLIKTVIAVQAPYGVDWYGF